jgi:hypothetical protein
MQGAEMECLATACLPAVQEESNRIVGCIQLLAATENYLQKHS